MASFIMAMKINPNAKRAHPDLSHHIDASLEVFARNGIKDVKLFATLGRYDLLALFSATDQAAAFKIASGINGKGVLETETWPVIPYEEFTQLIG